mgnify:CR=1 FL=1|tara:strand:+ start:935 stop:2020 length:1086 start_codon:yes stop_codon:yes gene_type:complete
MINIIAPINPLGYGVTGLNITKELYKIDSSISFFPLGQPQVFSQDDANVLRSCVENAVTPKWSDPCLRIWHQHDMSMFVGNGEKIGFPIFELETFDEVEKYHLSHLDTIFVCSQWAKNVILKNINISDENVHVIPLGVDRSIFKDVEVSAGGPTVFFNCGKWEIRKGHDILHELFNEAFDESDNVELRMMTNNPFLPPEQDEEWRNLYNNSKLGSKITFIDRVASHHEVYNIMKDVDCGIFPARTEGWNLELLELMSCGKSVIASNTSGHTEFCNDENSALVNLDTEETAYDGKWFRGDKGNWPAISSENKKEFVEHMKTIHKLKQSQSLSKNSAGVETAKLFSWENSANKIVEYINGRKK